MKGEYGNSSNKKALLTRKAGGFSLVEILVAASVFLIIALAFLALYTKSFSDIVSWAIRIKHCIRLSKIWKI